MNGLKIILGVLIVIFCASCKKTIRENSIQISLVNFGKVEHSRIEFVRNTLKN